MTALPSKIVGTMRGRMAQRGVIDPDPGKQSYGFMYMMCCVGILHSVVKFLYSPSTRVTRMGGDR